MDKKRELNLSLWPVLPLLYLTRTSRNQTRIFEPQRRKERKAFYFYPLRASRLCGEIFLLTVRESHWQVPMKPVYDKTLVAFPHKSVFGPHPVPD